MYDGTSDPFDHTMHFRQLMTLDIGNDALICKFRQAMLQVESYSMGVILQIFKRNINLSAPFFEFLAKKSLTMMDDLFRQMGYSSFALKNPRCLLSKFNGATTTSLDDIVFHVQADSVTLSVQFSVINDLSPYNDII
ncbi:hypothetical protein AAG906_019488 [Vitis piasezkii]